MANDILDQIEEKQETYYEKSFTELKLTILCAVITITGATLGLVDNEIISTIGAIMGLAFIGILVFSGLGLVNSIRSFIKKEKYGNRRIAVLLFHILTFGVFINIIIAMIFANFLDISKTL